mgnify:CR=1 FL=1
MKKNLVIFGIGKIAEVSFYYAKHECGFNVAAFCVDDPYLPLPGSKLLGLPILNFSKIIEDFPPVST